MVAGLTSRNNDIFQEKGHALLERTKYRATPSGIHVVNEQSPTIICRKRHPCFRHVHLFPPPD